MGVSQVVPPVSPIINTSLTVMFQQIYTTDKCIKEPPKYYGRKCVLDIYRFTIEDELNINIIKFNTTTSIHAILITTMTQRELLKKISRVIINRTYNNYSKRRS
jgi:hypothetical protein